MADSYKYWAFISYSHRDKAWADWLHKALETYRVPRRLVGRKARMGPVPARLYPVFRDREELPGSADLGKNISEALERSRYLVVICSPRSAVSHWVNEEIKTFKALGGADRVLCLIADGEPNASNKPDLGLLECFPPAIRFKVNSDRELTEEPTEPIAADGRAEGDGKAAARLKLIAGIIGVNYGELAQRERRRQFWRRIQIAVASLAIVSALGAVWYRGYLRDQEAMREQNRQLASLMIQKTRDAAALGQQAAAAVYGAHSVRFNLRAGQPPVEIDLLSSLSPPALLTRTQTDPSFHGGLVVHPNGELLATGSADGAVRLWKIPALDLQKVVEVSDARLHSVAFNPDGSLLAAAGADGVIRVLDTASWQQVGSMTGHQGAVLSVAFHPGGSVLASGGEDRTTRLWDIASGKETARAAEHDAEVNSVAYSPDGKLLVTGSQDNTIRLWEPETLTPSELLATYQEPVMSVVIDPRGHWLAAAVRDGSSKLWDLRTRKQVASLGKHLLAVFNVAFSPDGTTLIHTSRDQTMKVWEVSTRAELATLTGHVAEIWGVAFSPDGRHLYSAAVDRTRAATLKSDLKAWKVAPSEYFATLVGHRAPVRAVEFSKTTGMLASGSDDGSIRFWDPVTHESLAELKGHLNSVRSVRFSPDGRLLASGSRDKTIRLWNVADRSQIRSVVGHREYIVDVAYHPDGHQLATASWDHTVKLWSVPELQLQHTLEGHTREVSGVAYNPDGSRLASAAYDGTVRIWDPENGTLVTELTDHDRHVRTVAYDPTGRYLASGGWDRLIRVWDVKDYSIVAKLVAHHEYEVWHLDFHGDGSFLASATHSRDRNTLRLFDMKERKLVDHLSGHHLQGLAVDFSPDGRVLASGGGDNVIRLWRVVDETRQQASADIVDPGTLLRHFLETGTYTQAAADKLIERSHALAGFRLEGTELVPSL